MLISDFFGFVEVILGLVHASYSLPEGQAVKLSLHLDGSSGSWKSGKGFFFDFQFLGNDCPSWECVNLRECQVIKIWMEKNSFWRTVGKIWLWGRNWALELLILNLRIPHCLAFSYRWDPKFNTSFCNYFVSESGIFGVPLQNQLQDDKVRNEKASIPPFYTEVRTTTWAEA